jgi:hypothetical protein
MDGCALCQAMSSLKNLNILWLVVSKSPFSQAVSLS